MYRVVIDDQNAYSIQRCRGGLFLEAARCRACAFADRPYLVDSL